MKWQGDKDLSLPGCVAGARRLLEGYGSTGQVDGGLGYRSLDPRKRQNSVKANESERKMGHHCERSVERERESTSNEDPKNTIHTGAQYTTDSPRAKNKGIFFIQNEPVRNRYEHFHKQARQSCCYSAVSWQRRPIRCRRSIKDPTLTVRSRQCRRKVMVSRITSVLSNCPRNSQ